MLTNDLSENTNRILGRFVKASWQRKIQVRPKTSKKKVDRCLPKFILVANVVADLCLKDARLIGDPPGRCSFEAVLGELDAGSLKNRNSNVVTPRSALPVDFYGLSRLGIHEYARYSLFCQLTKLWQRRCKPRVGGMKVMADSSNKGVAVTAELRSYLVAHSIAQPSVNTDLVEATRQAMEGLAIMQIAEEQGPFLTWLARLIGTRRAVEVGTFTGLSALCIAQALSDEGRLTCFDINDDYVRVGRPFWKQAGVDHLIDVVIGPAAQTIADFHPDCPIDFVFIDADKVGYRTYYELLLPMLRPGGIILFDNALYFGAVLTDSKDADVTAIRELNDHVASDARVESVLLNVGDGLLIVRKL